MTTAERIKRARTERGLSRAELSYRVRLTEKTIQRWESGSHGLSLQAAHDLAKALDVSMEWLAFGEGTDPFAEAA